MKLKPRLLIVDDESPLLAIFQEFFEAASYDLSVATSGDEAIALLGLDRFDLVVVDLNLPGTDGISVLRHAKLLDPNIEVIILTGAASPIAAIDSLRLGAYDYILKPFDLYEMDHTVRNALERRTLREENASLRSVRRIADRVSTRTHSCFLSYSNADDVFATKLYEDLIRNGILCWKWNLDARTGNALWGEIDHAIRKTDKLLLIASKSSLTSPAVNREIERAIHQEDERAAGRLSGHFSGDTDVLFPVRLDDFIFDGWRHARKADVVRKVVADARGWDLDASVYAAVLERLVRDIRSQ